MHCLFRRLICALSMSTGILNNLQLTAWTTCIPNWQFLLIFSLSNDVPTNRISRSHSQLTTSANVSSFVLIQDAGWNLQAGSCQMTLVSVVWLCLVALFSHVGSVWPHAGGGDSDANNLAQVSCPWAGVFWRSTLNMAKEWQVMMVTFIMSKMLKMNDVQREDFSEELENLREVIRSVLTVCGERLVCLSDLWTLLTACRCLQDQVNLAKIIPSEGQIKVVLDGNPSTGAAPAASLGTFDELRLCPYRTVLHADMMAAIQCAKSLCKLEVQSDEFQQALLFLQDTHAFLRILLQLEKKSGDGCSDSETPWMIRLVAWMSVGLVPDVAYFYHGKKKWCCILLSSCGTSFARLTFPCPLLSYHDCLQLPSSKI